MTVIIDGTTGISTPGMTNSGNETVAGTLQVGGVTTNLYPLVSGTAQTAPPPTPQYFDFTSIPSTAKRITVMFSGVSTNGSSFPLVQLGTSGGVVATGYTGAVLAITNANAIAGTNFTTGFSIRTVSSSTMSFSGTFVFTNITGNTWVLSGNISDTADTRISISNGFIALSGTLDRVRVTTINGTDAFDAGTINIMWE